jgi:hypothetical protein
MYTQPCFIRSKSNTVINNLLELGYQKVFEEQEYVNCECIAVKNDEIIPTVYDVLDNLIEDGFIDCGTNRVMFYAVASLTPDHDNNQWFVSSCGQWEKQKTPSKYMLINGHKASIYEILKHFNPWE